jgi:hypothetical protein
MGEIGYAGPANKACVAFLIDTGSIDIILTETDARKLGISVVSLGKRQAIIGLGSSVKGYPASMDITFYGSGVLYTYYASVLVAEPSAHNSQYPSILGREIWSRWQMELCSLNGTVNVVPLSWDIKLP